MPTTANFKATAFARVAVLAILFTLLLASVAQAFSVTGGTPEQRAWVREAIEAQTYPPYEWTDSYFHGVDIEILDHYPPYWEIAALGNDEEVFFDVFEAQAVGLAWPGVIKIYSAYAPGPYSFLGEIAAHEWSHQEWFRFPAAARTDWIKNQSPGDSSDWYHNSAESFAEQNRVAVWPPVYYLTKAPRTQLHLLGNEALIAWVSQWYDGTTTTTSSTTSTTLPPTTTTTLSPPSPPTTTTTTVLPPERGDPFPDVMRDDAELWEAAWWAKDNLIFYGYPNGYFEPWQPITKRQVAFVVDRWVGIDIPGFVTDWNYATRADVREALPGLAWNSERWNELVLRSQLLRLMWRAQ